MIIDIHAHPNYYGYNCKKLLQNMDMFNIDKAWVLTLETPTGEYYPNWYKNMGDETGPMPFAAALSFVKEAPDRFILSYGIDPRRPDAIDRLDAAIDLYGVKVYGEIMLRMMYDNPDAIRMFRFCGKKGLPVIVEVRYGIEQKEKYPRPDWWYGGGIDAYERAIKACPETIFLAHGPGFWAHISGDEMYDKVDYPSGGIAPGGKLIEMLEKYTNLHLDLSAGSGLNALKRDIGFTREFLIKYQDRAYYGRDNLDNNLRIFLNSLGLPADVMSKIYSENALKLVPFE